MSDTFNVTKGPAAANVYWKNDGKTIGQLTLDWSYDAIDFKYMNQEWITLSIGPKTEKHEINKLDTKDKKDMFVLLEWHLQKNLKGYSVVSDEALEKLFSIVNTFA